jgi:hypothetical protein
LRNLTVDEFRIRQNSDRSAEGFTYFILPHATVESPAVNQAFIEEANRRKSEWHRFISRLFPKSERRRCFEEIDSFCKPMSRGQFLNNGRTGAIPLIGSKEHD